MEDGDFTRSFENYREGNIGTVHHNQQADFKPLQPGECIKKLRMRYLELTYSNTQEWGHWRGYGSNLMGAHILTNQNRWNQYEINFYPHYNNHV